VVPRSVLVVEDDAAIAETVRTALVGQGYEVQVAPDGAVATDALAERVPDLLLLDAGLPDVDGFSLCRWIREQHPLLPVIIVTARDADIDVVVGLDAGADDYVTKPFSMAVLLARVRANLRTASLNDSEAPIEIGRLRVEPAAYLTQVDGDPVELRPREFELLLALVRNAGRVVTRERLLGDVWDMHWDTSTKTLDMHIHVLRRKLPGVIEITTIRGVGYRLELP
jgi:DNA-binding response OmpR family regulator